MVLIADSGSTKTDWSVGCSTQGITPVHQTEEQILQILRTELLPQIDVSQMTDVCFYGSGVRPEKEQMMTHLLQQVFPQAVKVEAHSDLLGAARALCGHNEGISCILGTGANSCLYNGECIVQNTPALGYILGDKGSGAVLGKRLIHDIYEGCLSEDLKSLFETETGLTLPAVIDRVYRQPLANRFLASLSQFICRHIEDVRLQQLVEENFCDFFADSISPYRRPDLPVSFVGSIAWYFQDQLRSAASCLGYTIGTILRSPLDALVSYHS